MKSHGVGPRAPVPAKAAGDAGVAPTEAATVTES